MARDLRPKPTASRGNATVDTADNDPPNDPLNPSENEPSELDDLTHAELLAIYRDASDNIRFAKDQMWRTVLYFTLGAIAVTSYGVMTQWDDPKLTFYLLVIVWIFSIASVLIVLSLQWWQAAEHAKINYVTSKWSTFATAARHRKSKLMSDVQRYGMLVSMLLYLELVTIAVTRVFTQHT
ncbi:MAG: hypothetical protein HQ481_14895 [Alphaproteobacteria bacterium]|nr:hypothetical protein [Alphaproteobacteria bacterium]